MKKILVLFSACMSMLAMQPAAVQAWGGDCCDPAPCCDPCYDPCACSNNFYVGIVGGANFVSIDRRHNEETDVTTGLVFPEFRVRDLETGYYVGGTIGYKWNFGVRSEFEVTYRNNELKSRTFTSVPTVLLPVPTTFRLSGELERISYMANFIYDINIPCWAIDPYFGVGIGYDQTRLKVRLKAPELAGISVGSGSGSGVDTDRNRDKENGFAWQIIAGLGYKWNDNFMIALDYRFHQGTKEKRIYNNSIGVAGNYYF